MIAIAIVTVMLFAVAIPSLLAGVAARLFVGLVILTCKAAKKLL